jgi:hypothetical protein
MTGERIVGGSIIGTLIIAVSILGWRVASDNRTIPAQTGENTDQPRRADVTSQRMCADQAEHVFTSEGWRLDGGVVNGIIATYTNHYNARLNRCFMMLATTSVNSADKSISKSFTVADAFEGTVYGTYYDMTSQGDYIPHVMQCNLSVPNRPEITCHSTTEWQSLVAPYIETGAITQ